MQNKLYLKEWESKEKQTNLDNMFTYCVGVVVFSLMILIIIYQIS